MSEPGDPPIIITGGSVTIQFDTNSIKHEGGGRHHHPNKKIKRVEITGNGVNFAHDVPDGKITIRVSYGDDKSKP